MTGVGGAEWGVRLLGQVAVEHDGAPRPSRSALLRTVLALLAVQPCAVVPVDVLVDELWGEGLPRDPRATLQVAVTRLRRWLTDAGVPGERLQFEHDGYTLAVDAGAVDLVRFRSAVDGLAGPVTAAVVERADALLAAWAPPFGGCAPGPRLNAEAVRLAELHVRVVERRAEALVELGELDRAVVELQGRVLEHGGRERLVALLMLALYRAGRQQEALAAFTAARRRLVEHFGLEPGPALVELERRILDQDPALLGPPAVEAAPGRPAGGGPSVARRPVVVGRDAELSVVGAGLADGRPGRIVVVTGAAGSGKTTLLAAAAHDAAAAGATTGRGWFDGSDAPLGGWIEACAGVGIDLLGAGPPAGTRAAALADGLRAGLDARPGPTLLVLDDAHLADSASLALLLALARRPLGPGAVVVVAAREPDVEVRAGWLRAHADLARSSAVEALALGELDRASVEDLVAGHLPHLAPGDRAPIAELVWDRCGGHPLHLAALLDTMGEGAAADACLGAAAGVPERLLPMIAYQLAGLAPASRDAVEALAVLGPCAPATLAPICGTTPTGVTRALRAPSEVGLVIADGATFRLRHALTRQAVLDATPATTRHQLHRAWLDQSTSTEPFEQLRHAVGAGPLVEGERVGALQLAAGRVAYARGAFDEAIAVLRGAVAALAGDVDARLHLGLALVAAGEVAEGDDHLDAVVADTGADVDAVVLAAVGHEPLGLRATGDARRLARLERALALTAGRTDATRLAVLRALIIEQTLVHGEVLAPGAVAELESLADHLDSDGDRARVAHIRARALVDAEVTAAERLAAAELAHDLAGRSDDPVLRLDTLELLLAATLGAGDLERCLDLRWELARTADHVNRARSIWAAQLVEAALTAAAGDGERADAQARAALELGTQRAVPDAFGAYAVHLTVRRLLDGRLDTMQDVLDLAVATYPNIAAWHAVAAAGHLHAGRLDEAAAGLATFVTRRRAAGNRHFDRAGLCYAAAVAFALGDAGAAEELGRSLAADPGGLVVVGVGAAILGPTDLYAGLCAAATGDAAGAAALFDRAAAQADARGWAAWSAVATDLRKEVVAPER